MIFLFFLFSNDIYSVGGAESPDLGTAFFSNFLVKYYRGIRYWAMEDRRSLTFLLNAFKSSAFTPWASPFRRPNETSDNFPSGSRR